MQPEILYQDADVVVINKPAGLLVHPVKISTEPTLTAWLLEKFPEIRNVGDDPENRPGIVHRLDKATSGVMVIPRTQKAFEFIKNQFQKRTVKKTYIALVWGKVAQTSGLIDKPLAIKTGSTKRTTRIIGGKMVKEAKTAYRVKKLIGNFTLLEVEPLTGRTHQIRAHLASIGHPVVGDKIYGKKLPPEGLSRMFLHAESLEFTLPSGGRFKATADLPTELNSALSALAKFL
ncbi:MAG: RluA family pseudouridine synthase [Candidatus Harrisonbacteria bacterium]|nr:RluA family pseudouridine synthase [Candidatus Harrisonbacteria bacterium]